MKYLVCAALLVTCLGVADSSNKIMCRIAEEMHPLYYCDGCGSFVADLERHAPICPGKGGN